jgi:DNA helicase-2/ATP-dependent DNA helicase PcrA
MSSLLLDKLNPEQRLAASSIHGPFMILAGAGTGKTRVITSRIAHMIHQGVAADSIVAMTFTNKAAREMKQRVGELVDKNAVKDLFVGTFHGFCLNILRTFYREAGLHRSFSLAGTSVQIDLVRKALEERHWEGMYRPEDLLARISQAKNSLLTPHELSESNIQSRGGYTFQDNDIRLLKIVYELYERQLHLNRIIDFDDCIFKVAQLLSQKPEVKAKIQEKYQYFLVDEYQDTNMAQLKILELMATAKNNICVVGDDDQSIYSWRGAMSAVIDHFERIFPGTTLIKLEQNYRCSTLILDAANHVIKNNSQRKEKTLWSQYQIDNKIALASHEDDQAEATWVASRCLALMGQGHSPKEIGLLYRANAQAKALEFALREINIPYKVYGGSSFFEKKEVKDFLAYFKLCLNHDDRISFYRVINTPSRGFGLKTLEKIENKALSLHKSPFQVLLDGDVDADLSSPMKAAATHFKESIKELSHFLLTDPDSIEVMGRKIIANFRLEDAIRQKTTEQGPLQKKLESLRRLPQWLKQIVENNRGEIVCSDGTLDTRKLMDKFALLEDGDSPKNEDKNENHVSLMTIHSAKGLEFPIVFICGVEEEILPHKNSIEDPNGVEEERRLFYVAITRAKQRLFISYAKERSSGFQSQEKKPSRFLKEVPQETLELITALDNKTSEEDKRKKNLERLQLLKSKLKTNFTR